jgi:hypothetical protein
MSTEAGIFLHDGNAGTGFQIRSPKVECGLGKEAAIAPVDVGAADIEHECPTAALEMGVLDVALVALAHVFERCRVHRIFRS